MKLYMARSITGRDKGNLYVVLGEDGNDVLLVDGIKRTMDRPKRKRRRHVQPIIHFSDALLAAADECDVWTDESVKRIIRLYSLAITADS